ncbi:class I SAM-dependent methyltransferase [Streptomyces sp. S.PNR 29]|uniref:class I SAM-dependent methyltransferase n=1 Tax=Streptomyces sp. S.PNR 29 TaxID=2973805 RepID=UPI0025AF0970|nr:class I SAM-dependent methyltransferase [Streptomyces sp. S.PNR 29]MDN0198374.1 class I SAM-dependent methyltransferase [Streptomyces sp. S.PNR 29]
MGPGENIASAYNDDSVLFRVLRHLGWDSLANIGWFTLPALPVAALAGPVPFQRRLARRSLALLDARPGQLVLDAGCGRGDTTARLGAAGCRALGVDIQPAQIDRARRRFGDGARFAVADATALPRQAAGIGLTDGSFDRVHCLEAAFHFGHEGRRAFLDESFRLLRPGGRLVLVDVTARTDQPIGTLDPNGLVRATWRFDDIEPYERYPLMAAAAGFTTHRVLDWTTPVLHRASHLCALFAATASTRAGRQALCLRWPGLRTLDASDWDEVIAVVRAHRAIGRVTRYTAYVLDKPANGPPDTAQ